MTATGITNELLQRPDLPTLFLQIKDYLEEEARQQTDRRPHRDQHRYSRLRDSH